MCAKPVTVCVDVLGGDEPPSVILQGAADALSADKDLFLSVAGTQDLVGPFAAEHERASAVVCTQSIGMDEHPLQAIRTKKDSSIVRAVQLLKAGEAQAFFSAGSTGACMAAATLMVGRISGIERPALCVVMPGTRPTVLLDVGANADCKPSDLVNYARMGSAYARVVLGLEHPRVGLLNIGSEDSKGSIPVQKHFEALKSQFPGFAGNAEGSDILDGRFDVIVADGFTGNVALKTAEGTARHIMVSIKELFTSSNTTKMAALVLAGPLRGLRERMSGEEYGGAILLGVKSVVVIGHGATSARAVSQGIQVAARAARDGLVDAIAKAGE